MTLYIFRGVGETVKVKINSRDNILLSSSKTKDKYIDVSARFYDSEEEKRKCLGLTKESFEIYLAHSFLKNGYRLIQKIDDK